jgi:hypothetical protein
MSNQLTTTTSRTINLPVLDDPQAVAEVMEVNLEGMQAAFPRIKFPSGGMLAFEVPSDEGSDVSKELTGVIIDQVSTNTYWSSKFTGEQQQPDCFSGDGKIGRRSATAKMPWPGDSMECSACPLNQYGSETGGKGKACKNMRKLYMVREGEILPVEITIPPSSLAAWQTYSVQLTTKVKPLDGVVTKIKLKKATSAGGIEYSQGVFSKVADLTPDERIALRNYARNMRAVIRQQAPQQPVQAEPTATTEELPF